MNLKERFYSFYNKNKNKHFYITTHKHADLDGIISAYALHKLFPNSELAFHEDLNYASKRFLKKYNIEWQFFKECNNVIVVDSRTKVLLPHLKDCNVELIIDHHKDSYEMVNAKHSIINPNAYATAQIIANIYPKKIDPFLAYALSVAIISDTYRFKSANEELLYQVSSLLKISSFNYKKALEDAFPPAPLNEKIALLSNIKSLEFINYKEYIIAYTFCKIKEGDTASLIAEAGDVGLCIKEVENGCRISARASHSFPIPLNEIMSSIGKKGKGAGGGHSKAAGAFVAKNKEDSLRLCIETIEEFIDRINQ